MGDAFMGGINLSSSLRVCDTVGISHDVRMTEVDREEESETDASYLSRSLFFLRQFHRRAKVMMR